MTKRGELLRGLALSAALGLAAWFFPIARLAHVFFDLGLSPSNSGLAAQGAFLVVVLLGAAILLRGAARKWLGFEHAHATTQAAFFALPSHVVTTWIALAVALPTHTLELERHSTPVVRAHAAPIVRITTEGPLVATLLSSALIAAIFEETFFRGLLWTALARLAAQFRTLTILDAVLKAVVPLVACTLIFALLHADTPGGVGIVRVVSATVLGLVCGLWRIFSKSTVPAIVIHTLNNVVAIGRARGWMKGAPSDLIFGVPAALVVLATLSFMVLGAILLWNARRRIPKPDQEEFGE